MAFLVFLTALASVGLSVSAQESGTQDTPAPTTVATSQASASDEADDVTELPATGRGQGVHNTEQFAVQQMLVTMLVLIATAALSLGVIALMWRSDRR